MKKTIKSKRKHTDENGYWRYENNKLVHREIAYKEIYKKERYKFSQPFGSYIVHHIDENKKNNNPSNLLIMFQDDHEKIHGYANEDAYHSLNLQYLTEHYLTEDSFKDDDTSKGLSITTWLIITIILLNIIFESVISGWGLNNEFLGGSALAIFCLLIIWFSRKSKVNTDRVSFAFIIFALFFILANWEWLSTSYIFWVIIIISFYILIVAVYGKFS